MPRCHLPTAAVRYPLRLEQRAQRGAVRLEQRRAVAAEHAPGKPRPPRVAPREERVACRRADPRRRMRVDEAHAFGGEPVDVGRGDGRVRLHRPDVSPAEVVGEDQHHVGRGRGALLRRRLGSRAGSEEQERKHLQSHHISSAFSIVILLDAAAQHGPRRHRCEQLRDTRRIDQGVEVALVVAPPRAGPRPRAGRGEAIRGC